MTAPGAVDVMEVMDREVARAGGESYLDGRDLIEARAAVAELIEAAHATLTHDPVFDTHHEERLRAALARIGGSQ
ncbi:hypothetical protein ACQHIH_16155 [Xanthomonas sontii]|uniref:hypothetical protein n=1 Tax=Xanthomonas sontii TaxID=2650745 RepID=UPI003F827428